MESQNSEKKTRGGARAGAGRPSVRDNVKSIGIRIPADIAEILERQKNKSLYIIEAIRYYESHHGHQD